MLKLLTLMHFDTLLRMHLLKCGHECMCLQHNKAQSLLYLPCLTRFWSVCSRWGTKQALQCQHLLLCCSQPAGHHKGTKVRVHIAHPWTTHKWPNSLTHVHLIRLFTKSLQNCTDTVLLSTGLWKRKNFRAFDNVLSERELGAVFGVSMASLTYHHIALSRESPVS